MKIIQPDELTEHSTPSSDLDPRCFYLIIKIERFSNERVHIPGQPAKWADFSITGGPSIHDFTLDLYVNGITSDDKGYVTAVIEMERDVLELIDMYFEFSCVVSVIDASENRRFPKSYDFAFNPDWLTDNGKIYSKITFDRLFERDFLLKNKEDLLPGDCLSLRIDVTVRVNDGETDGEKPVENVVVYSFVPQETGDGVYLPLDSGLAVRLAEVSDFFQRMLETPMVEMKSRHMEFEDDEFEVFRDVCFILMGVTKLRIRSISHVCHMYILADMYLLPIVVESCRDLLTIFLRVEDDRATVEYVKKNITTLQQLANLYNDVRLKEDIDSFLMNNTEDTRIGLETEWKLGYSSVDNESDFFTIFLFVRNKNESPSYNFYH